MTNEITRSLEEEIRELSRLVSDLTGVLRVQREKLKRQGLSLPPGTLSGLKQVHVELENLANRAAQMQSDLERLEALAETTSLINSSLDLEEVLNGVMDTVIQLTGAERGYIVLRNPDTGQLEFKIARNMDRETMDQGELIVSRTVVQQVAQSAKPIVTFNAQVDPRFSGSESIIGYNLRSILCAPLLVKDQVTGVIYTDNRAQIGQFSEKEMDLLMAFANQASVAIENARLFEQVKRSLAEITQIKDLMDNIFASIASGVVTTDHLDRVTTFNRAAEVILAIPAERAIGAPVVDILPPMNGELSELLKRVRDEGQRANIEIEPEIPERGRVVLSLKLSPLLDAEGQIQGVATVIEDLSELKQREEQLKVIRRYLPPAMVDNIRSIDELGLSGKRRNITVLFVDVRSFETFDPTLDVEQLVVNLNQYLTVATEAIHSVGGIIDKYMGNEVMGLFNTQLNPQDDHAYRAVEAALRMALDFMELENIMGNRPDNVYYRIGIHTGIATLGNVGSPLRKEFSAIGDTVNLAKRLQENATTGQIIISEDVYRQCAGFFKRNSNQIEVISRGSIRVKGRRQLTPIYEVRPKIR